MQQLKIRDHFQHCSLGHLKVSFLLSPCNLLNCLKFSTLVMIASHLATQYLSFLCVSSDKIICKGELLLVI